MNSRDDEIVRAELDNILSGQEFKNSRVLRQFLRYIVIETIEGRSSELKSLVVAQAVFGRDSSDEGAENIVRSAAVRLRTALCIYNAREGKKSPVLITLPKGRYIPEFTFNDGIVPAEAAENPARIFPSSMPSLVRLLWVGLFALGVFAAIFLLTRFTEPRHTSAFTPTIIVDQPVALNEESEPLAHYIGQRLAPQLARIGLARIERFGAEPTINNDNGWPLHLAARVDASADVIHWELSDGHGAIRWSAREPIEADRHNGLSRAISRIAFRILGENGAIPLLLEREQGEFYSGTTCTIRAQLLLRVQELDQFNEIRSCLLDHLEQAPHDPAAWASLSATLAVRSRYRTASLEPGYEDLIDQAVHAANRAIELAPEAYLTQVAMMQVALSRANFGDFLTVQEKLRSDHPGDLYLHLRIASRLARLGQGQAALDIYEEAASLGASLAGRNAELALAHFVESNYEQAHSHILQTESRQQYVLVLGAAILGHLGHVEQSERLAEQLLDYNPDFPEEFYPWHTSLGWDRQLLEKIDAGLAISGIDVIRP